MLSDQDPLQTEASESAVSSWPPPSPPPTPAGRQPPREGRQAGPSGGSAQDSFAERAAAELSRAYPDRVAGRTRRNLLAMIERGRERARGYGFESEEHALKFLHCVMLLDNELAKASNPDVAYVMDTLTVPNKPAERRIDRALSLAKKIA